MNIKRNYRVQTHERQCSKCIFFDSIREAIYPGDNGKQKFFLCILDRTSIEKSGICDAYKTKGDLYHGKGKSEGRCNEGR